MPIAIMLEWLIAIVGIRNLSTTIWVEPPSTGVTRRRGALN